MEKQGEDDSNASEEMLVSIFSMVCIVAENMVSVDVDVKFVAFFPSFLDQPGSNIILAHVINQVF